MDDGLVGRHAKLVLGIKQSTACENEYEALKGCGKAVHVTIHYTVPSDTSTTKLVDTLVLRRLAGTLCLT